MDLIRQSIVVDKVVVSENAKQGVTDHFVYSYITNFAPLRDFYEVKAEILALIPKMGFTGKIDGLRIVCDDVIGKWTFSFGSKEYLNISEYQN
jgi:hypothetical protein